MPLPITSSSLILGSVLRRSSSNSARRPSSSRADRRWSNKTSLSSGPATVTGPLDKDVLLLHRLSAREELGRLAEFELDLLSTDPKIKLEDVIGKGMTVGRELPGGKTRYF